MKSCDINRAFLEAYEEYLNNESSTIEKIKTWGLRLGSFPVIFLIVYSILGVNV